MAADAWGVGDGYHDGRGQWHDAPDKSRAALRNAFGADLAGAPADPLDDVVRVALVGSNTRAGFAGELVAEDGGTERIGEDFNLGALPPGYYTWTDRLVIVASPVTLGDLRSALSDHVRAVVVGEVAQDLTKMPNNKIAEHLQDVLAV